MLKSVIKAVRWQRKKSTLSNSQNQTDVATQTFSRKNSDEVDEYTSNPLPRIKQAYDSRTSECSQRTRILVLDPDLLTSYIMESMFPAKEFEIVYDSKMLTNGSRFVMERIFTPSATPHLVLLDITFTCAINIIKEVRNVMSNTELPILLCATQRHENEIELGLAAGANDFVYKPLRYHEMTNRVNNLMQTSLFVKKGSILRDILPMDIIDNLEHGINYIAKYHPMVTILFSDICSYTVMCTKLPTKRVIHLLNTMFCGFDDICLDNDVYKVETIGDSYMIASGHDGNADHVDRMIKVAKQMIQFVNKNVLLQDIRIRIGIHTGSAHSGVIGNIRPRYCFFGDTVNTASRMESHGIPNTIHVSEATFKLLKNSDDLIVEDRGDIEVKGKGILHTYLLSPVLGPSSYD